MTRAAWLAALLVAASTPAAAQPPTEGSGQEVLAESLFREAKELATQGDYAHACPKFAESHRLDPQLGTLLHLATCHEQQGLTASAWAEYLAAADLAASRGEGQREALARERASALEPKLARLVVEVGQSGVTVTIDDRDIQSAAFGTPLPVDPGEHVVAAALGEARWSESVRIAGGPGTITVRVPPFESTPSGEGWHPQLVAGVAIGAVGVAGLLVMAIFGGVAIERADAAETWCKGRFCEPEGLDLYDQASTYATVSTVGLIVGIAGIGAGLIVGLTAPWPGGEASAWVAPVPLERGGMLAAGARW
jgi:hypothetical protein